MRKKVVLIVIILCLGFFNLHSKEKNEVPPWGFIFNTNNLLLDIESYQAGVGIKTLYNNNVALRYLADVFYSSSLNAFSGTLGATFEKHFKPGKISPYWGGFIDLGYKNQKYGTYPNNGSEESTFLLSVGIILGAEFFILEFISVFAEYNLSLASDIFSLSTSTNGEVFKTDSEMNYLIDSGIGNSSSIGIVIYLEDVIDLEKDDKP